MESCKVLIAVEGQYITANNKKIHYTWVNQQYLEEGKPLIIFLHDALGSIGQWKDFPQVLTDKLQLPALVYDRYGHGKSEQLAEKRTPDYLHDEALQFLPDILKGLGINNPLILLGHSDGGAIALLYASHFTDRVIGVICEAGHVFVEEEMRVGISKSAGLFDSKLKDLFWKYHGENTKSIFFAWVDIWLSEEFADWNIEGCLPNITAPVLAIQGEDDEFGHLQQPKPIASQVGGPSQELWVKNCGHIPHHQQRKLVLAEMVKFIEGLEA